MKPYAASIINSATLVSMGCWGYFGSETASATALIPVGIGVVLAVLIPGLKKENKIVAHIVVVITFLTLLALVKPLVSSIGRSDAWALGRVGLMMLSTLLALVYFIKSFRDARKNRKEEAA